MAIQITVTDGSGATTFDIPDAVETAMTDYRTLVNEALPASEKIDDNAALVEKLLGEALPRIFQMLNRPQPESPAVTALRQQLKIAQRADALISRKRAG